MLRAFFESIKYVGHQIPLVFLRVFMGYAALQSALIKYRGDFLYRPRLAAQLDDAIINFNIPLWYKNFLVEAVIPHWQTSAFIYLGFEFAVAISFIVGYVVRPMAILNLLFSVHMLAISGPGYEDFFKMMIAINFVLAWSGAGRCLGLDYYFYKRHRGIWW